MIDSLLERFSFLAGVSRALDLGAVFDPLEDLDPFEDLDPLEEDEDPQQRDARAIHSYWCAVGSYLGDSMGLKRRRQA